MDGRSPWLNDSVGAVSLTFDDGNPVHLTTAIPMLNEYGLQGTFYVNPPDNDVERLKPWREAYLAGHEIGNHTVQHICGANFGWGRSLETSTLDEIEADIVECTRRLREGIPELGDISFCYPCYQDYIGSGANRQSYVPVVARHFIAARGRGEVANHPERADLHYLWSYPVDRESGAELVRYAQQALQGRWVILTFHGVGDGHAITRPALDELFRYLAEQRDLLWTAPVIDVAKAVKVWRSARAAATLMA